MTVKLLAAAAAMALLGAGAAHAGGYGTPPYESGGYAYAGDEGGTCEGFTIVGAHAGVTVLGINVGAGGRARIGGDCGGYRHGGYAPPPPPPVYQEQGYEPRGAYYNQEAYAAPVAYAPPPVYVQPAYAQPVYSYAPAPCGCQTVSYGYAPY